MKARVSRLGLIALMMAALIAAAAGCGPKADVSVFMMFPQNSPFGKQEELKAALQAKLGESPTVELSVSPIFDIQKLLVELAAGSHGVFVFPEEQFEGFKKEEGFVSLDDLFNKEDFPKGVSNGKLIGVPLKDSKWLKDAGYKGTGEIYAFTTQRVKNQDQAKQVLKAMAER